MPRDEADLETLVRAARHVGGRGRRRPGRPTCGGPPTGCAPRASPSRSTAARGGRRRVKTPAELAGIRRAQRAAEARHGRRGRAHPWRRSRRGSPAPRREPLTAEMVRAAIRAACAATGAPAPPDIMVARRCNQKVATIPAPDRCLPICRSTVDLWPRDEASGCCADMTRTFVGGGEVTGRRRRAARHRPRERWRPRAPPRGPGSPAKRLYEAAARRRRARRRSDPADTDTGETLNPRFYWEPRPWRRPRGARASRPRARSPRGPSSPEM